MSEPRVLVGGIISISQKQAVVDFLKGLKAINYENKETFLLDASREKESSRVFEAIKGMLIEKAELKENAKETIALNRNKLAERALKRGFDFLLLVGLEQMVPKNVASGLVQNGKKICSALCLKPVTLKIRKGAEEFYLRTMHPMAAKKQGKKIVGLQHDDVFPSRLMRVDACSLSCILIHKDVLKKIKFRTEAEKEDFQCFADDCKKHGFEQWLDSSIVCRMSRQGQLFH